MLNPDVSARWSISQVRQSTWFQSAGELDRRAAEQEGKAQAAAKAAARKEKEDAAAQFAAGDVVVKRLQGRSTDFTHDVAAKTLKFEAFGTFGAPEALVTSGVLYYEVVVLEGSEGILQIGFSLKDGIKSGDGPVGEGCGDEVSSWALDGTRGVKWFEGHSSPFACKWKPGDVIGLATNVTAGKLAVSKNGKWTEGGCGVVLEDAKIKQGVFPCLSAAAATGKRRGSGGYRIRYAFKDLQHAPPDQPLWSAEAKGGAVGQREVSVAGSGGGGGEGEGSAK